MNPEIRQNALHGKIAAITGATGSLGSALCRDVLKMGGRLILLTRSVPKSDALRNALLQEFPQANISRIPLELTEPESVKAACEQLQKTPPDILCLNAGGYCLPRTKGKWGFDPVFETNFVSQYYMARTLLPCLEARHGRILVTGSIAYMGAATDPRDMDFSRRSSNELVYGNAKRYLMFALWELVQEHPKVWLSIAHPGITPTGITRNYSPIRKTLIKYPMKLCL